MKKILQHLFEHKTLSREMAKEVLVNIGKGVYNEHEVTAFMTVYLMRSITIEELQGFRDALLELCIPVDLNGYDAIDIVGTGGDGKNTFNISTLSCFVVAGAGQKVAKHGNYGASSISGASNVMEQVGYKFKNDKDKLKKEVDEANICFLHAPIFHPALKTVGPIRKNLGDENFFQHAWPNGKSCYSKISMVEYLVLRWRGSIIIFFSKLKAHSPLFTAWMAMMKISLTNDTKVITNEGEKIMTPEQLGKEW
jgi:anthranilate phosphoribosyltransferase